MPIIKEPKRLIVVGDPFQKKKRPTSPVPRFKDRKNPNPYLEPGDPPPPPVVPQEPAGPGKVERKFRAWYGIAGYVMHLVTESKDFVGAFHDALPVSLQCYYRNGKQERGYSDGRGKKKAPLNKKGEPLGAECTLGGQMRALMEGIPQLGDGEALEWLANGLQNALNNQAMDKVQGKLSGDAAKKLGDKGMPFPLAGPAL